MSENYNEGRRDGLKEAAEYLRATASDYRQMARQVETPARNHFSYTAAMIRKNDYQSKAELLDGQAKHVEGLA